MGESINYLIEKTDLVILSCENTLQLEVAEKYAELAEDAMLRSFGSNLTREQALKYDEFKSKNKQKIASKNVMLK